MKRKIKRLFKWFLPTCECGGKIHHLGSDITNGWVWKEVYECDKCHKEFV